MCQLHLIQGEIGWDHHGRKYKGKNISEIEPEALLYDKT